MPKGVELKSFGGEHQEPFAVSMTSATVLLNEFLVISLGIPIKSSINDTTDAIKHYSNFGHTNEVDSKQRKIFHRDFGKSRLT